jgi:DNA repair protein RadC
MHELIADLPLDDRPRERMLKHGPGVLSNAELVAVLIGSGLPGKNALQLAREVLRNGLGGLATADPQALLQIPGMGPGKVTRIFAAIEFYRRVLQEFGQEPAPIEEPAVDTIKEGARLVTKYSRVRQERLGVMFLDSRSRLLNEREVYVGTIDNALVSTRDIIRFTMEENAVKLILFHNHPSGDPTPSEQDIDFTKKMKHSLSLCDIQLLDHLVVGRHGFYSMHTKGLC